MYDFVAIDFETATSDRASACAIGIVAVKNLEPIDRFYSLIQPPQNYYAPVNVSIHGISPEMTADAPTLTELWPQIKHFFDIHIPIVAHNASFDMSVLRQSSNVDIPEFTYFDSIKIASFFCTGSKKLTSCATSMDIPFDELTHHNALDDAMLCAMISAKGIDMLGCKSMWEFAAKYPSVQCNRFVKQPQQNETRETIHTRQHTHRNKNHDIDILYNRTDMNRITQNLGSPIEFSPVYGKNIVFTGILSIDRWKAKELAVNAGACVKSSVSSKTDYLIVGIQDTTIVLGNNGMSAKEEKAHALNESGKANIVFLNEEEFMNLVGAEVRI